MRVLGAVQLIVVNAACVGLSYFFLLFVYRIAFHPLRKYPGPVFAKLLDAYGGVFALLRRLHLVTYKNHVKYGSVVRQAPNRLVFNTANALHDIYQNPRVIKSPIYRFAQLTAQPNIWDSFDGEVHRRKRKIISQPLTEKAMRGFEPTMTEQIDTFVKQLRASATRSEPVNMSERCTWLSGDIIGQLAFGCALNEQTEDAARFLQPGLVVASLRLNVYMQWPLVRILEPLVRSLIPARVNEKYVNVTRRMIEERVSMDKHAKSDLYSYTMDAMQEGDNIMFTELWAEAFFFIGAGGMTIAANMSALFFYLSRNPTCHERLADEIRSTFKSVDEIHPGEQLRSCKYLQACINEALRCATPNTGTMWRRQPADDKAPLVIDGHAIPAGTDLGVNLYSLHHNEDYFPEPFSFKPERWLESETPEEQLQMMKNAFAPFMLGARACPGKAVAQLETNLTLARTLWELDFEATPGKDGEVGAGKRGDNNGRHRESEFQLYDVFSGAHDGPMLNFYIRR